MLTRNLWKNFCQGKGTFWTAVAVGLGLPGLGTLAVLAVPTFTLTIDAAAALAGGIGAARKKAADQLEKTLAHRRAVEASRLAKLSAKRAEADKPTRAELLAQLQVEFQDRIDTLEFIPDEEVRERLRDDLMEAFGEQAQSLFE